MLIDAAPGGFNFNQRLPESQLFSRLRLSYFLTRDNFPCGEWPMAGHINWFAAPSEHLLSLCAHMLWLIALKHEPIAAHAASRLTSFSRSATTCPRVTLFPSRFTSYGIKHFRRFWCAARVPILVKSFFCHICTVIGSYSAHDKKQARRSSRFKYILMRSLMWLFTMGFY